MNLLLCYTKEKNEPAIRNCSNEHNSTSFKECIASFEDDVLDNFMLLFGQIQFICDYFNTSHPSLTKEDVLKVVFSCDSF